MGNQLAKEQQIRPSKIKQHYQKRILHHQQEGTGRSENDNDTSRSNDTYNNNNNHSNDHHHHHHHYRLYPDNNNSNRMPKPIRHRVVIADKTATPVSLLSTPFNNNQQQQQQQQRKQRTIRIPRRQKRRDTHSLPSIHSSEEEEEKAWSSSSPPLAAIDDFSPLSSSLGSSTATSAGTSSSMIVFDSAIAHAEHAAADIATRRQQQQVKMNSWVYEYGKEKEYNRQLRQHYVLKQVFGGNQHVEFRTDPQDILECACGTGLWTLEIAQTYPSSNVVGMDIVPPTSDKSGLSHQSIPPNATYAYGDVLAPLQYNDRQFDYVYQRDVAHIVPMHQWPFLIAEFHRILRPGGQVELVEYDLLFKNPGPVLALVNEWYKIASDTIGVDPSYADALPAFLAQAGFEDVHVQEFDIPIGEWPSDPAQRQFGFLYKEQMKALFQSMKRWWVSELHVSEDEYDHVCLSALEEFEDYHCSAKWKIVTATKKF